MPKKRRAGGPKRQPQKPPRLSGIDFAQAGTFALIFAATLVVYLPSIHGAFLWDDENHVTKEELQSLHGLWLIWSHFGSTAQYYPVLHSAFWIENLLWGDAVLGYHLTNVVLHSAAACLLILIVRRLELPAAWLAGFVFALHPVCVEAVAWISEQKSTLSAFFCFASALVYLHFERTRYFDRSRSRSRYFLASALFVLALLSKTVTATLPAVLLVIFWWQRGRLGWKRDIVPLLPWFALSAGAGVLTPWVEKTYIGARGADFSLTALQRGLLACRDIWFYAGKIVWPSNLTFIYPHWNISPGVWWQYLFPAGILAVLIVLGWMARSGSPGGRGPLASFLIFAGMLFPALGFFNVFPFLYSYVADHFQYLASVGLMAPLALGFALLSRRISPRVATFLPVGLLVVLGVLTWRQTAMYRDSQTLYRETIRRNPDAWMAHNNLAYVLLRTSGASPEVVSHLETAIRLHPQYVEAHDNLGIVHSLNHEWPQAVAEYEAALRIDPAYVPARTNLGDALSHLPGRMAEALSEFETALRYNPNSSATHYDLALVLTQIPGRGPEAIAHLQTALRLQPDYPQAQQLLAELQQHP